jgi:hypothetical protein
VGAAGHALPKNGGSPDIQAPRLRDGASVGRRARSGYREFAEGRTTSLTPDTIICTAPKPKDVVKLVRAQRSPTFDAYRAAHARHERTVGAG